MKKYIVFGLVLLILLLAVVQTFQISQIKDSITGKVTGNGGETYTEMMARMYPDQAAQKVQAQGPTMVGGC
ncbi:MAG TPA: hypothetical protein VJB94_05450 [Candidatus Nanoarchaeia archaeon]|nr:hypothetical protein [Candidatus Nanoarchaeia archaeon]